MEPDRYKDVLAREDKPLWIAVMQAEMDRHTEIRTWELVDIPEGRKEIGCRWVYTVKTIPEGEFEKAKAWIVAQGFTQCPGMDYYK